jgi:hypothetical protein
MPSSPNYKRNYKQEYATETTQRRQARAERDVARRLEVKEGKVAKGDGMDVNHIKALGRGGPNTLANLNIEPASINRSFSRNSNGSMKSEVSKKERKKK